MLARLAARLMAWRQDFPPVRGPFQVTRDVAIPMRDGTVLLADLYDPIAPAEQTVLVRGPYGRASLAGRVLGILYAGRGHQTLIVSSRGTFGSGGDFDPGQLEVDDAADVVAWLRGQPWYTGTLSTVGASYLGFTQWALLADPPAELRTSVIGVGPHDFARAVWGTGSFALLDFLAWAYLIAHQEEGSIRLLPRMLTARRRLARVAAGLPVGTSARALLGDRSTWFESWLAHPDVDADFWAPLRLESAVRRVSTPVLLTGGWQDVFVDQTLEQFQILRERGVDARVLIGPWTHGQGGGAQTGAALRWLDGRRQDAPVRLHVTGADEWRDLPDWPPPARDVVLHPAPGGLLDQADPGGGTSRLTYDPADPTPGIGGRYLSNDMAGYRDDTALAGRRDVLAFTGPPLPADLEVIGRPRVVLDHCLDAGPDTGPNPSAEPAGDVFVRLSEVDEKGRSRNVADGQVRTFGADGELRIDLDPIAHRFRAGRRLRLVVAGGAFPRFARNPADDEPLLTGSSMVRRVHELRHGAGTRLVLPVPDGRPDPDGPPDPHRP